MSATVKLHPAERLLNELGRAERRRSGDLLTRQRAEFDILVRALDEARAAAIEECARVAEEFVVHVESTGTPYVDTAQEIVNELRSLLDKPRSP